MYEGVTVLKRIEHKQCIATVFCVSWKLVLFRYLVCFNLSYYSTMFSLSLQG